MRPILSTIAGLALACTPKPAAPPSEAPTAAAPDPAADAEPDAATDSTADLEADAPAEPTSADDDRTTKLLIGIPVCDEFITDYVRCIDTTLPEGDREMAYESISVSTGAWRTSKANDDPEIDKALEQACSSARKAAAPSCGWPTD